MGGGCDHKKPVLTLSKIPFNSLGVGGYVEVEATSGVSELLKGFQCC